MHATTSIGRGRAPRHVCVKVTIAGALASATLLAILNPSVIAWTYQLRTAMGGTAPVVAMSQTMDDSSVLSQAGSAGAVATGNAYGGRALSSGQSNTQTVMFTNTGTTPVTALTATGATCSQTSAGQVSGTATDFCEKVSVRIALSGVTVFNGTAGEFGRAGAVDVLTPSGIRSVAPNQSISVLVTITFSPEMDNTYQGLQLNQPIQWRFGA